ncbi:hypothetical protein NS506_02694 [Nocardia seriolae]|uniref:PLL-like beta propeller domain-containing protein n=1 Tax=Nocardia seriolae TaxID=37332 RepID=A0ABC8ARG8_9NOCA|nr:hypothetical protein NS506_02694 [Nocardia seriolae]
MDTPGTAWGNFQSLGGSLANDPAVTNFPDGRLIVFAEGAGNTLWYIWQNRDLNWNNWKQMSGAVISGTPAVMAGKDGLVRVFWRSPSSELFTATHDNVYGSLTQAPLRLTTGAAGDPVTAMNADGRMMVFYRGNDDSVWCIAQKSVSYGPPTYEGWLVSISLGGRIKGVPAAVLSPDGRVRVYVRGSDDNLWVAQQPQPDSATWNTFQQIGTGMSSDPKAARDADGRIRVCWRGSNGAGWALVQQADYNTYKAQATLNGGLLSPPNPMLAIDGRLELFVTGTDSSSWVAEQTAVNQDSFADWITLKGGILGSTIPARNMDGRLSAFVRGTDNAIWYAPQNWI